jgi:hypothetical protein
MQSALDAAQRAWKTGETTRFAAAEARWREESAKVISEARARAPDDGKSDGAAQIDGLRGELAIAHAALANREAELAQLRQDRDSAADGARRDIDLALENGRKAWSEEEASRLTAARSQWQEQASRDLEQARALLEENASEEARQLRHAREQLALVKATLSERDGELERVRSSAAAEAEKLQRQAENALEDARNQWNAEEAARLATVEAKWREEFAASQTEHKTGAEQEPAEPQAQTAPAVEAPALRDSVEVLRLRDDVERLKSKMAIREVELAQARAVAEQARARLTGEPVDLLPRMNSDRLHSDRVLISTGRNRSLPAPSKKPMPWRDIGIVAAVAVIIFLLYPHIVSLLPGDWFSDSSYSDDVDPAPAKPVARPKPVAAPIEMQPTDITIKSANVRTTPAKTADLVTTLDANVAVRTLERNGNWAHVEFGVGPAKKDGWVLATALKALQAAPTAAAPPAVAVTNSLGN